VTHVESKLAAMGLSLPEPMRVAAGVQAKWRQVRVVGDRVVIAGHGPRAADGSYVGPSGKVGGDLTVEQGYHAAKLTGLAILGDLKRELGDLDRVSAWVRVLGMVNSAPGFVAQAQVIDGFTDLMIELYGEDSGMSPRAVAGMAELPFNSPVIIEGEVTIDAER
jgi:enamine deaminase RidA (YjgF/YER057c/UK114 family)